MPVILGVVPVFGLFGDFTADIEIRQCQTFTPEVRNVACLLIFLTTVGIGIGKVIH